MNGRLEKQYAKHRWALARGIRGAEKGKEIIQYMGQSHLRGPKIKVIFGIFDQVLTAIKGNNGTYQREAKGRGMGVDREEGLPLFLFSYASTYGLKKNKLIPI